MTLRGLPFLVLIFTLTVLDSFAQTSAAAIALGNRHAVALRTNGEVLTWGENLYCQLGRGSRGNSGRTPVVVMRNAKQIAAASDHTLVLATLSERSLASLTANGRVNALYFLTRSNPNAWSDDHKRAARDIIDRIRGREQQGIAVGGQTAGELRRLEQRILGVKAQ